RRPMARARGPSAASLVHIISGIYQIQLRKSPAGSKPRRQRVYAAVRSPPSRKSQRMLRVAIIGPVEPFRSGVARHTTALARAFARRTDAEVRVFSFSRQYPSLLFPGESD